MAALRRSPLALLLIIVAVVVFLLPSFATVYTDWLWFGEVGYQHVFLRILLARLALGGVVFAVAFGVLYLNIRLAQGALRQRAFTIFGPEGPRTVDIDMGRLRPLFYIGAAAASAMLGLYASARWDIWLMARNAVPFGSVDPILGFDIAFYVFQLPFLHLLHSVALMIVLLAIAAVAIAHFAGQSLMFDPVRGLLITPSARQHLSVLVAMLFLLLSFRAWLGIPDTLTSSSGILHGASYVDVYAGIPVQWVLVFASLVAAGLALYQWRVTRLWPVIGAVGIYFGVVLLGSVYGFILQRFIVAPNEQVREAPFIAHSIAATRAAFALDRVEYRPLSGEAALTPEDIERNAATLDNVPLWADQQLLDTFGQIQEIRTYYDFVSVDNDRYLIDGEYRQIMLSAREMNSEALPSGTWINERLTFTHGYGLTLGPVNEVTPEGLPVLFIRDLPLRSLVDLQVKQPAIYFGELSNDHVFVRTRTAEFDYPSGEKNVMGSYQGQGGIPLNNVFQRLLFAIRFKSPDTLFSPSLTPESRVLMYRRIAERVQRIAPFLTFDPDPYLAISDGRLVWIQDAYTTSDRYPYSMPNRPGGINYIRNSVKATIDAYHGTTTFHLLDPNDPIAATLDRVFPGFFKPMEAMPEDLRTRLRYPQAIFSLQASIFATFHMTNPNTFYNREDQWDIPSLERGEDGAAMQPYYTIMKLPGETEPEYIQMLPYTPRQKDNLAAWLAARNDGENYGRLVVVQFPKETVIFGPRQIAARINQDQEIAPQITLWNQQGSTVIHGPLLVIPIEEALIYIRPMYLRAAGGRIPELARVVVAYQNRIVMEPTLDDALARLFPGIKRGQRDQREPQEGRPPPQVTQSGGSATPPEETDLAQQARQHYERAIQAQREGNWALYGEEIKRLGEVLKRMN